MSDEEQDFEKTQIYLPPGKGEAPRPQVSKTNHEALLKPTRETAVKSGVKLDFDITGELPPAAAAPKDPPPARPTAVAAPAASGTGSALMIATVVALVVALGAYLLLR